MTRAQTVIQSVCRWECCAVKVGHVKHATRPCAQRVRHHSHGIELLRTAASQPGSITFPTLLAVVAQAKEEADGSEQDEDAGEDSAEGDVEEGGRRSSRRRRVYDSREVEDLVADRPQAQGMSWKRVEENEVRRESCEAEDFDEGVKLLAR